VAGLAAGCTVFVRARKVVADEESSQAAGCKTVLGLRQVVHAVGTYASLPEDVWPAGVSA
jgi:hypothetical protein